MSPTAPPRAKPQFNLGRALQILGLILLAGVVAFGVMICLYLRPYYDKAQAYDLSQLRDYAHQDAVALEKVPRHMIDAVVVAEDPQFFGLISGRL